VWDCAVGNGKIEIAVDAIRINASGITCALLSFILEVFKFFHILLIFVSFNAQGYTFKSLAYAHSLTKKQPYLTRIIDLFVFYPTVFEKFKYMKSKLFKNISNK
jgi:hypothetical protein